MGRRGKGRIIVFLFVALIFMGIGYSVLQSNLNISGTAKSSGSFGVQIVRVDETQDSISNGGVSVKREEHTTTTATFVTEFIAPGDYVEYKITVENTGTIDAVVSAAIDDTENELDEDDNPIFIFTAIDEDGLDVTRYRDQIDAGERKEITVKIKFNEEAVGFPSEDITITLTIDAVQKAKSNYTPSHLLTILVWPSTVNGESNQYLQNRCLP